MEKTKPQLLARAIAIAAEAHQRQLDKAGSPYILHPLRMMMRAQSLDEQIVAVLHDVVEDSDWTLEQVALEGFGEIITALDCLTHRPDEGYDDYLDRILTNRLATQVKFYDLEDNMTLTRLSALTERDLERVSKYHQAHHRLLEALVRARP
jgi:hypothetical protein